MYERKSQPLAPPKVYYRRIINNFAIVSVLLVIMLAIGTVGYRYATVDKTCWLDAFHNASMILSGMGPLIDKGFTEWGKVFSAIYALFSGIVFVGAMGYVFAPGLHRIFHRLHLEQEENDEINH